jgi:hypothetical protein
LTRPGKRPRTGDLDAVVEDLDPDVIAGHAVGPMDDSVHDSLEPGVFGNQADIGEAP